MQDFNAASFALSALAMAGGEDESSRKRCRKLLRNAARRVARRLPIWPLGVPSDDAAGATLSALNRMCADCGRCKGAFRI